MSMHTVAVMGLGVRGKIHLHGLLENPNYYKDSLIVKHHKLKYSSKMPLWVIVEFSKKSLIQTVETVIDEYRDDIDLNLIGFPENYLEIMKNNL